MNKFEKELILRAKEKNKTLVFPEAQISVRIVEAAKILAKKKIAKIILIGDESALLLRHKKLEDVVIINPKTSSLTDSLAEELFAIRKAKGMTLDEAKKLILDPFYFSTMLLKKNLVDGMVGGAETATKNVLKPPLQIIKAKKNNEIVSSCFVLTGKNKLLKSNKAFIFADCGLVEVPTEDELVSIASASIETALLLGLNEPKVAFLSYSSLGSAPSEVNEMIRNATLRTSEKFPKFLIDGELQFDAAVNAEVAETKAPKSKIKGDANIFIFPNLQSGNITYKAVQRFTKLQAIGPIIQNLAKPVNDLSRGCTIKEIILASVITILQCEK